MNINIEGKKIDLARKMNKKTLGLEHAFFFGTFYYVWFCGVVVITSALHAEGREFEPRQNLAFGYF